MQAAKCQPCGCRTVQPILVSSLRLSAYWQIIEHGSYSAGSALAHFCLITMAVASNGRRWLSCPSAYNNSQISSGKAGTHHLHYTEWIR
jgi:hypothetical protein